MVAVDRSDGARDAVRWAAEVATAWGTPLRLLHVAAPGASEARSWLRETADLVGSSQVEVAYGPVVDVLADEGTSARLLVLGSYGAGAVSGMLAGTVALALIDRISCPIAVVRGRAPGVPPPCDGPVVVGADGSVAGSRALLLAAGLATMLRTDLVVVRTWAEVAAVPHRGVVRRPAGAQSAAADELEVAVAAVAAARPGLRVEREPVAGTPVRALLERARTARLLVVGHRGTDPGTGMLHGSTSKALVEFAPCPVVVTGPLAP